MQSLKPLAASKFDFEALAKRFKQSKHETTDLEILKATKGSPNKSVPPSSSISLRTTPNGISACMRRQDDALAEVF